MFFFYLKKYIVKYYKYGVMFLIILFGLFYFTFNNNQENYETFGSALVTSTTVLDDSPKR